MGRQEPRKRVRTDGGDPLAQDNPFAALSGEGLPEGSAESAAPARGHGKNRPGPAGKVLTLRRLKAGRGGKVVTEIAGLDDGGDKPADLLKRLQARLGTGGTLRETVIELQGERRAELKPLLEAEGYRVKGGAG
jgi:translation initiation factor 1